MTSLGLRKRSLRTTRSRKSVEDAASRLGLSTEDAEVRAAAGFDGAFAALVRAGAQAVLGYGSPLIFQQLRLLVSLAAKNRLPDLYIFREAVAMNGLMSYGVSNTDLCRRSAGYVDRILRGAKAAELPGEQPTKYELAVNTTTAKRLGITIPRPVLLRADEIIQ